MHFVKFRLITQLLLDDGIEVGSCNFGRKSIDKKSCFRKS